MKGSAYTLIVLNSKKQPKFPSILDTRLIECQDVNDILTFLICRG